MFYHKNEAQATLGLYLNRSSSGSMDIGAIYRDLFVG
jgi:hypothetical protein